MRALLLLSALCGLCLSYPVEKLESDKEKPAPEKLLNADLFLGKNVSSSVKKIADKTETIDIFKQIYEVNKNNTALPPGHFSTHIDILGRLGRRTTNCDFGICLWPKSSDGIVYVPYTISSDYRPMDMAVFRSVFNDFEDSTCIRFIPRESQKDFLSFEDVSGCFSSMGVTGGSQLVSLKRPGCMWTGIVTHEVLHALGLHHEHVRKDRDQYVSVQWDNIQPFSKHNFVLSDTYNMGLTSYDYQSIMHYSRTAFSVDGNLPTLVAIPDNSIEFGQRIAMTSLDYEKINKLYQCSQKVTTTRPTTTQPTTTKTTTKSTTTTTRTTTTRTTTTTTAKQPILKQAISNGCGGIFTAPSGVIVSPNYPNIYPNNMECMWNITSPLKITITFTNFDIEEMPTCLWDSVTIYNGPTLTSTDLFDRYCGKKLPPVITSYANALVIVMKTDAHVGGRGFRLLYQTG